MLTSRFSNQTNDFWTWMDNNYDRILTCTVFSVLLACLTLIFWSLWFLAYDEVPSVPFFVGSYHLGNTPRWFDVPIAPIAFGILFFRVRLVNRAFPTDFRQLNDEFLCKLLGGAIGILFGAGSALAWMMVDINLFWTFAGGTLLVSVIFTYWNEREEIGNGAFTLDGFGTGALLGYGQVAGIVQGLCFGLFVWLTTLIIVKAILGLPKLRESFVRRAGW